MLSLRAEPSAVHRKCARAREVGECACCACVLQLGEQTTGLQRSKSRSEELPARAMRGVVKFGNRADRIRGRYTDAPVRHRTFESPRQDGFTGIKHPHSKT